MSLDLRRALPLGLGILGLAAVVAVFRLVALDSNLKASSGVTLRLKADLEKAEAENRAMRTEAQARQAEMGRLASELDGLRTRGSEAGRRNDELARLVGDAEKALGGQNAKVAELEARLREAEEKLKRQRERNEALAAARAGARQAGYTQLMESEWLSAVAQTDALQKELKGTLTQLADDNEARSRMRREVATMHYNLAVILTQQGKFEAAEREYARVLEVRPDDPEAHYNLAVLYDTQFKNRERALEHYRRYVAAAPNSPDAAKVRLWIQDKEFEGKRF